METSSHSGEERKYNTNCCCCLQDGSFRDVTTEYYSSGKKEVYGDMLKNALNVQITSTELGANLICEQCVARLRDAAVFRQMVLDSQELLHTQYTLKNEHDGDYTISEECIVKMEEYHDSDAEYGEAAVEDTSEENEALFKLKAELLKEIEDETVVSPKKRKGKGGHLQSKRKCTEKTEGAGGAGGAGPDWAALARRRGAGPALRHAALRVLAATTACVFQWSKSWYRCFCCTEAFQKLESLREHTETEHTLEDIEKKIISQQNRMVKVEISVLNCKLCSQKMDDLEAAKSHLAKEHGVEFVTDEELLIPFKISDRLQCQLCSEHFHNFRLLNMHMNTHFRKHICHICGAAFSNLVFLNLHKTRTHRPFECKQCDLLFTNKGDKTSHDATVHGVKVERKMRFPCPYCDQRFSQENFKVKHLVDAHGMVEPAFKCDVCEKVFITKSLCNNHIKTVHMKEKNRECDICHKLFYNKSDVLRHRVTHTGEKKFACSICQSPFATKDSLRRHLKRSHSQYVGSDVS